MSDAIIKTEDLVFRYTTEEGVAPTVLDGVDLTIREGSFVAVLGHNGSGKSTLAKHFNAILLPSGGQGVCGRHGHCRRGAAAGHPPSPWAWCSKTRTTRSWPAWWKRTWPSPRRIWEFPRRRSGSGWTPPSGRWACTEYAARTLPTSSPAGRSNGWPSPGCMAMRPRCVVLDEPTAMLDPVGRAEVMSYPAGIERDFRRHSGAHHPPHGRGRPGRPAGGHGTMGRIVADGAARGRVSATWRSLKRSWGSTVPETSELDVCSFGKAGWTSPWTR